MTSLKEVEHSETLISIIESFTNKVCSGKQKIAEAMTYIDLMSTACEIVEQVSQYTKSDKKMPNLTSEEKYSIVCTVIKDIAVFFNSVKVPGKKRTVLSDRDYDKIVKMTGDEMQDVIGSLISILKTTEQFGAFTDFVSSSCLGCFGSKKKKIKKKKSVSLASEDKDDLPVQPLEEQNVCTKCDTMLSKYIESYDYSENTEGTFICNFLKVVIDAVLTKKSFDISSDKISLINKLDSIETQSAFNTFITSAKSSEEFQTLSKSVSVVDSDEVLNVPSEDLIEALQEINTQNIM